MLYLQIASPKSSVLNFLDSNSFEVIISIFQRTEKVPDMERLRTYGHLYPNTNLEVANKLTGVLHYTPATQSIADYTSNQFTASYHRELE